MFVRGVLASGGEIDMGESGELAVVVADNGHPSGDVDAGAAQGVEDAHGEAVVVGHERDSRPSVAASWS